MNGHGFTGQCFHCGRFGHKEEDCHKKKFEENKKAKLIIEEDEMSFWQRNFEDESVNLEGATPIEKG